MKNHYPLNMMSMQPRKDPEMASKLKRVSNDTERVITDLAEREDRTFVAQLDRVVIAGLDALGLKADGTPKTAPKAPRKRAATAAK